MKRVYKIFGVLFILLFQFTSCLNDDHGKRPIYYFYDGPVVVDRTGEYPFIRTESYLFYVPELAKDTALRKDDLLWSSLVVDLNDEDYPSVFSTFNYTAKYFKYEPVDSAKVIIPANVEEFQSYLSDDYSAPIELSVLYNYAIDSLFFFGFKQKNHSNQLNHTYELILDPEIENGNYPTLYIRSKQVNASTANPGNAYSEIENIFAFDVADFVNYYRKTISSTGLVQFNLKYKTDVDETWNDIYKEFMSNPISWDFSSKKTQ